MLKNVLLTLGWIVAVGMGATLYIEMQTIHELSAKLTVAQEAVADVSTQAEAYLDLEKRYEALEHTVAELKKRATEAKDSADSLREEFPVPETVSPTALLKKMLGEDVAAEDSDEGGEKTPRNPMAALFEGEAGERMMKAGVQTSLTTQYLDLFTTLDLPQEREDTLRDVLRTHLEDQAMAGLAMMRGEAIEEDSPVNSSDLAAAVAEVLSPEEMALFEQHEAEMPARVLRQQFDMQIGMMAPGIEAETRQYTVDVLVDHMLVDNGDAFDAASVTPDLSAVRARYEAAATQLEAELAPEDMAQVRGFLDQLNIGLDMAASMMGQIEDDASEASE